MKILKLQNINAGYKNKIVLKNISLDINEGEFISILGANGAGKTTLIKTFSNICKIFSGEILFKDKNILKINKKNLAKNIAIIPQSLSTPFEFTVEEFVTLGIFPHSNIFGISKNYSKFIAKILDELNLFALKNNYIQNISSGEFQRVLIAQGLAQEPKILILDEPIAHLDIYYQKEILDLLTTLNKSGITIISTIHDINLANKYSSREIFLKDGRIIADGRPQDVCTEKLLNKIFNTNLKVETKNEIPFMYF